MSESEKQMKLYLGLPEDFSASFDDLYKVALRFEEMTGNDQGVTVFGLIWWLDIYGDFTEKTDPYSKIVNKIFSGMGDNMVQLFPFIELCQNKYVEEEE